jgi:hypothetical protein
MSGEGVHSPHGITMVASTLAMVNMGSDEVCKGKIEQCFVVLNLCQAGNICTQDVVCSLLDHSPPITKI